MWLIYLKGNKNPDSSDSHYDKNHIQTVPDSVSCNMKFALLAKRMLLLFLTKTQDTMYFRDVIVKIIQVLDVRGEYIKYRSMDTADVNNYPKSNSLVQNYYGLQYKWG